MFSNVLLDVKLNLEESTESGVHERTFIVIYFYSIFNI